MRLGLGLGLGLGLELGLEVAHLRERLYATDDIDHLETELTRKVLEHGHLRGRGRGRVRG